VIASFEPQSPQNRASERFSALQLEQVSESDGGMAAMAQHTQN
jgi:hypothetical protein